MTVNLESSLIDTVSWLALEFGQILDVGEDEEGNTEPSVISIPKVPKSSIPSWNSYKFTDDETTLSNSVPKFKVDVNINKMIHVGDCNILGLDVGVITIFLDEVNKYKSKIAETVQIQSGRHLNYAEVLKLRCGEALLMRTYNIKSDNVIFAMSSRYSPKYHDASSNILNMAIRESLKLAINAGISTIAYPLTVEKDVSYPTDEYLHTLLRTVRKWLEMPEVTKKIEKVFFIGDVKEAHKIMRRYFPRNNYEEYLSADLLTAGNDIGELVDERRNIRISAGFKGSVAEEPKVNLGESYRISSDRKISRGDDDFDYYLKLSYSITKLPIYTQLESSGFVKWCGTDKLKRPTIAIDAKKYDFIDQPEYALSYALGIINPFLQHKIVLVVLNLDYSFIVSTAVLTLLRDLCRLIGIRRAKSFGAIYFHKCGWTLRGYLILISALLPKDVWDATVFVDSYKELKHYTGSNPSDFD